jgi:hypothetical protein
MAPAGSERRALRCLDRNKMLIAQNAYRDGMVSRSPGAGWVGACVLGVCWSDRRDCCRVASIAAGLHAKIIISNRRADSGVITGRIRGSKQQDVGARAPGILNIC